MLLGLLYERYGTYDMREYGGLAAKLPWVATMFVITGLSIIGLPMLNSFVGEFLILSGSMQSAFAHHHFWTALATLGVILSAAYMLTHDPAGVLLRPGLETAGGCRDGILTRANTWRFGRWSRCF